MVDSTSFEAVQALPGAAKHKRVLWHNYGAHRHKGTKARTYQIAIIIIINSHLVPCRNRTAIRYRREIGPKYPATRVSIRHQT